ncbi:MAG: YebC/PmpR family DNA-binding transcriptional regulator [Parvularculales bacterium]
MAGHSKFKNIQFRKGAQDKKRARVFSRLAREITVAARQGAPRPEDNPRLRTAIQAARAANMPGDNIQRAIKRSSNSDTANYEEVRYEGFGNHGVGVIVETLTDNRNRTAGDIRSIFSKYGGSLGENGSVSFMFDHVGAVVYPSSVASADDMLETAIEVGANECDSREGLHELFCATDRLHQVAKALEDRYGEPQSATLVWKPQSTVPLDEDAAKTLIAMLDALDDNDDVQTFHANFDVPDDVLEKLSS